MENTLEENIMFADLVIKPIMMIIDSNITNFDPEKLAGTLEKMKDQASSLAAWPTEETMHKAATMELQNQAFALILALFKSRLAIIKDATTPKTTIGEDILKSMGL